MQQRLWRSRTFRFWIICYLIVMLIPLVFSGVMQAHTSRQLRARAYEDGGNSLNLLASVTDERLSAVFNMANTICSSSEIVKLRFISLPFDAKKYYEIHSRASFLSTFVAYSDVVNGCYVYCRNLDCILDAHHIYTRENQFSRIVTQQFGMTEGEFSECVAGRHAGDFRVTMDGQRLLMIKTVSSGARVDAPPLTLIMTLDPGKLSELFLMTGESWQGQALLLLPDSDVTTDWITSPALLDAPEDSVVVRQASALADEIGYALVIPRTRLLSDARSSAMLFMYFLLCTLALGGGIAYLLARHNYKPVRELSRTVNADVGGDGAFTAISRRLTEMRAELARLSVIENQQIFEALLSGKLSRLEAEQLDMLRANFDGDLFIAALMDPEREDSAPDDDTFSARLRDQLTDGAAGACQCVVRPYEDGYAAVLCFAEGGSSYDVQLYAQKLIKSVLTRDTDFPALSAYIGGVHEGLQGVGLSCREAAMAREYANFVSKTGGQVVLYDESMVSSDISWREYDIVDAERRFIALMLDGNYNAGEQLMHEIISYYTGHEGLSLRLMQTRMYGVMNMMLNVLHEVEPDAGQDSEMAGLMDALVNARTMQELEDVTFQILGRLHARHDRTKDQLTSKLDAVTHYINVHYYDENLSVQMLADKYELSLPYLSREFKNMKGIGVLNYINQYRVEKAKEILLNDEAATLTEVAQRVGYSSSQTLIRIFKRYEGVTPGQYRAEKKTGDCQ